MFLSYKSPNKLYENDCKSRETKVRVISLVLNLLFHNGLPN